MKQFESEMNQDNYNRILFEESSIGLALTNMSGEIVDVNQAYADIIGFTIEEVLKLSYWDITPQKYEKDEELQLQSLNDTGKYGPYEKEYRHKDGHLVPVSLQGRLITLEGQQMIWSSVEDISNRKVNENKIERNRVFQNALVECIDDAIIACDSDGVLSYFNQAAIDYHGLPKKSIKPDEWAKYYDLYEADGITPLSREQVPLYRALTGETVNNQEIVIISKDLSKRVMLCSGRKLIDSSGNDLGAVVSMTDITERKNLEEEETKRREQVSKYNKTLTSLIRHPSFVNGDLKGLLAELVKMLSDVLNVSRVSIWRLNIINTTSSIECMELWDSQTDTYSQGVVLGSVDFPSYFDALITDRTLLFDDVYTDERVKEFTQEYFPANGITSMLDAPFHFSGKIAGVLCLEHTGEKRKWKVEEEAFVISAADIVSIVFEASQRKELETTLQRTDKMDSLGKLTGGVAHDYNNMLGVIIGYADLLKDELTDNPKLEIFINEIRNAGERGAKLTEKLLDFSRHRTSDSEVVNINTMLHDQHHMLEKTLTARIKISFALDENLWPVLIDSSDLENAILNMSINSMHSIKDSGELKFTTENISLNDVEAELLQLHPGDYVTLSIRDNGSGMTEETRLKIFDPFYSTKGEKGTGLGLSQVYGFVQRSNAVIKVYSEPEKGTQFKFYFPRSEENINNIDLIRVNDSHDLSGSAKVLIVDDEPALVGLAREILGNSGYRVLMANNAKEALSILETEDVDILMTDIVMPEMDGIQLAKIVKEKYPNIKIQLVSGYADRGDFEEVDAELEKNILNKPFNSQTLLVRFQELNK